MSHSDDRRIANLLGALTVGLGDRLSANGSSDSAATVTLSERGPLTIEFLRRVIGLSHSATVRLVDRLVEARIVERGVGPDGRSISVRLTPRGRRRAAALRAEREQVLVGALASLNERERAVLEKLAEKLLAGLTTSRRQARYTCRLCNHAACAGRGDCPVDLAAAARGE